MSVDALRGYREDVASGGLFLPERIVPIDDDEFEKIHGSGGPGLSGIKSYCSSCQ